MRQPYLIVHGEQNDPDFLKTLAGASVRVTIAEGGQVTQDLRMSR